MNNYILIKKYNYPLIALSAIFGQQGVNWSTTSLRIFIRCKTWKGYQKSYISVNDSL